jgi:hypothetical protein
MEANAAWKDFFAAWPDELPRRGIVIAAWDEQIPFAGFMTGPTMLLLARTMPDSLGARTIILPYEQIAGIKVTEVVSAKLFQALGFSGKLPKN